MIWEYPLHTTLMNVCLLCILIKLQQIIQLYYNSPNMTAPLTYNIYQQNKIRVHGMLKC